jgi:hypothetical protein
MFKLFLNYLEVLLNKIQGSNLFKKLYRYIDIPAEILSPLSLHELCDDRSPKYQQAEFLNKYQSWILFEICNFRKDFNINIRF